jgi:hypothetical protein
LAHSSDLGKMLDAILKEIAEEPARAATVPKTARNLARG